LDVFVQREHNPSKPFVPTNVVSPAFPQKSHTGAGDENNLQPFKESFLSGKIPAGILFSYQNSNLLTQAPADCFRRSEPGISLLTGPVIETRFRSLRTAALVWKLFRCIWARKRLLMDLDLKELKRMLRAELSKKWKPRKQSMC